MTNIKIVPATQELMNRFYGKTPIRSVKAVVAVKDDQPIAVAGVYLDGARYVLFSELTQPFLKNKKALVYLMRSAQKIMEAVRLPVYAVAGEESNDGIILKHLGFQQEGGVYIWHS